MRRAYLTLAAALVAAGASAALAQETLIFFDEDGGNGQPRGLYTWTLGSGNVTLRAPVAAGPSFASIAGPPTECYGVDPKDSALYRLDLATGAFGPPIPTGLSDLASLAYHPQAGFYGLSRGTGRLYAINPSTGSSRYIANVTPVNVGLIFNSFGDLYGFDGATVDLYQIGRITWQPWWVGGSGAAIDKLTDCAATADGDLVVSDFRGAILRVDVRTGGRTVDGQTGLGGGLLGLVETDPNLCDPCDCNCDGEVNAFDIEPFIDMPFNGETPCSVCAGDINGDGRRDAFDIDPFIDCLFGP